MSEKKTDDPAPRTARSRSKVVLAAATGALLVAGFGAVSVADHFLAPDTDGEPLAIAATSLPVSESTLVCGPTIAAASTNQGATDSAYAPGADHASSTLRGIALGDRGMRVPGARIVSGIRLSRFRRIFRNRP